MYAIASLAQWSVCRGVDSRHFHNYNIGLGMQRVPPSLVRTIGQLYIVKQWISLRKSTLVYFTKRYAIHIIPSYCLLQVSYRYLIGVALLVAVFHIFISLLKYVEYITRVFSRLRPCDLRHDNLQMPLRFHLDLKFGYIFRLNVLLLLLLLLLIIL